MDAAKVGKIEKALKALSQPALRHLGRLFPDTTATVILRDLTAKGLSSPVLESSIRRAAKNGFDPFEALTYGVFSSQANATFTLAAEAVLGRGKTLSQAGLGKLPPETRNAILRRFEEILSNRTKKFLGDVDTEVRKRMIEIVMEETFQQPSVDQMQH